FVFYHLAIDTTTIAEVTRNLRLMEKVIKFSIVKDTISHLKAKVKPVRVKTSAGPEGSSSRPSYSRPTNPSTIRSSSSQSSSSVAPAQAAPVAVVAPAPVAAPTPSTEPQSSP